MREPNSNLRGRRVAKQLPALKRASNDLNTNENKFVDFILLQLSALALSKKKIRKRRKRASVCIEYLCIFRFPLK